MIIQNKIKKTFAQKILAFLLALCIMSSIIGPIMSDGITALASAPSSYSTITTNSTASVRITSSESAKYFKFVPTQSGTYKFYSSNNSSSDPKGSLLDANGNSLISNDDGGSNNNFSITYDCVGGTTYYVKAYMYGSSTGSYTLNVTTISIACAHNYVLQSTTAADCENDGVATYVCSLCNESYRSTVASALGHNYVNGACTRCAATDYANVTCINIATAGGTNYSLFNSGRTENRGYDATHSINLSPNTHNNSGYDLYGEIDNLSRFRLGLSFTVNIDINEQSTLSVKAWDVDESYAACGYGYEYDYIYLIDETSNTSTKLNTHLSGQNDTWNTSAVNIPAECFAKGHTYHFEFQIRIYLLELP